MTGVDWSFWLWALPIMAAVLAGLWRWPRAIEFLLEVELPRWSAAVPAVPVVLVALMLIVNVNWRSTPGVTSSVKTFPPMSQAQRPAVVPVLPPRMRGQIDGCNIGCRTSTTDVVVRVQAGERDWDLLADCETGDHDTRADGSWLIHRGTARWTAHDSLHQGGVQFAVSTWDRYRTVWLPELHLPADAHLASRDQQITVAKKVLELEGAKAWPRCSIEIGWRRRG